MWLHVPASCLSQPAEEASTSVSGWLSQTLASSVTWRGTLRRARFWSRKLSRDTWMTRLFGRTPEPSMAALGVERWIASLRDTPASPSPLPDMDWDSPTNATSGPLLSKSLLPFSQPSSSLKTWLDIFEMDTSTLLNQHYENLATQARRRSSVLLQQWAHRISASEYSPFMAWRTPMAGDGKRGFNSGMSRTDGAFVVLPLQATKWAMGRWATPVVAVAQNRGPAVSIPGLLSQSRNWESPIASWMGGRLKMTGQQIGLLAPTITLDGDASSEPIPPSRRRYHLNPVFVEWLMGWPRGWTSLTPTASASSETA